MQLNQCYHVQAYINEYHKSRYGSLYHTSIFLTAILPILHEASHFVNCKDLCYNLLVDLRDFITAGENEDLAKKLQVNCENRMFDVLDHSIIVRRCSDFCKKTAPVIAGDKELKEQLKSTDWKKTVSVYCKEYACKPCPKLPLYMSLMKNKTF
ncbi:unnamed protein product [Cylicocyclus nassatus]|uniref:Uncharacterized protein n=1 Tax=Cylicocyclus nassatus TaxID=53992 RepID=A0AA36DSU2_CYLNA|nr:unnamed protein product [Cylicocyclus nassatus]